MTTALNWQDPIDLSLIQRKLENNFYASVPMFLADVRRTCSYRSFTVYCTFTPTPVVAALRATVDPAR